MMALTYITVFALLVVSGYCSIINTGSEDIKPLLEDILKRLDEKEARIDQLEETVRIQQTLIQQQQTLLQQQQTNMDDQNHRIIALEQEVLVQKQIVSEVDEETVLDDTNIDETNEAVGKSDDDKTKHDTESQTSHQIRKTRSSMRGSSHLGIRQVENETPVAFLASLTNHTHHLDENQHIAFDRVVTNIGDAYNELSGVFIAPVPGIYVFSTTLLSYRDIYNHFAFEKNGNMVVRLYHNGNNSLWDTTSSTIVLQLTKGDDVTVTNLDADKDLNGNHYSTFTGFLLQQIYDDTVPIGK